MSSTQQALAARSVAINRRRPSRHPYLHGSELAWALAFVVPYAGVIVAFAVYPIAYALWMGGDASLYAELFADPHYAEAAANTALFAGFAANTMMFLALLLSGFFMRRRWWIKAVLVVCMLPWALPAIPAFVSFHWMLIGEYGFLDSALSALFGIEGPHWFNNRWLALGSNSVAYIWKWLPFWTLIFLAGRLAIPQEIYEAADMDGARGINRFVYVTFPLLAGLYLICTLLSTVWMIGDFTTVYFVSGGAPSLSTEVLATLGMHDAFDAGDPPLGMAVGLSVLPLLIPLVILLMRKVSISAVQL